MFKSRRISLLYLLIASCFFSTSIVAEKSRYGSLSNDQEVEAAQLRQSIVDYLSSKRSELIVTETDIHDWSVSDIHTDGSTGVTHIYIQQAFQGIRVFNGISSVAMKDGQVISLAPRFITDLRHRLNSTAPAYGPEAAIRLACDHLDIAIVENLVPEEFIPSLNRYIYPRQGPFEEVVQVTLFYVPYGEYVRLAWNVNVKLTGDDHWWNLRFDALSGEFLGKDDWVVHCDFGPSTSFEDQQRRISTPTTGARPRAAMLPSYLVYDFPAEAPTFGASTVVTNPSDPAASPFGWHDIDGIPGNDFTTTQGNNVFAYDDSGNQNAPGHFANGGAALNFNFPVNFGQSPSAYMDASITNLFFVNNRLHDIFSHYGFDEASGNFQAVNYSGTGVGGDHVKAECQDGGGMNNANFYPPVDGMNGRMQMYLWGGVAPATLDITSPTSSQYNAVEATFSSSLASPLSGQLFLADDGVTPSTDACDPLLNAGSLSGKIVVIERGICDFIDQVNAVQTAGALAAIVINDQAGPAFSMGGSGTVSIPAFMISMSDGAALKNSLSSGTVFGTINPPSGPAPDLDGSLDNGVITHEFAHGVSVRLTGGAGNSSCLYNGEQAGEGWSDYFALLFTIEPGDLGQDARGIGTYVLSQAPTGTGIRRFPYSTDPSVNPQSYYDLLLQPEVHKTGEIWCSALWDMTWLLIGQYGFDPDWINGFGGNNIALRLVMQGLKLQPCNPGFIDSRDAILMADHILYQDSNHCLIWQAFAGRGMGVNAFQGDANIAGDETVDFSVPGVCQQVTTPPNCLFTADVISTCFGAVHFTDQSTGTPQYWLWDFGDGTTSTQQHPFHNYSSPGNYTVKLKVTNSIGVDSLIRFTYIYVNSPPLPVLTGDVNICSGDSTTLNAIIRPGDMVEWYQNGDTVPLHNGTVFTTPPLFVTTSFSAVESNNTPILHAGPQNVGFALGGFHRDSLGGRLLFTTYKAMELISVAVNADSAGNRTFVLYDYSGNPVDSKTINVSAGSSRVQLHFRIPVSGDYQIGVPAGSGLFRNNTGANYPYTASGLFSITGTNSPTTPLSHYYYLYDWEARELQCRSQPTNFTVNVESPPVAAFTAGGTGFTVQVTNSTSGNISSYVWDFGDGFLSGGANPMSHTYTAPGTYILTLTVTTLGGCVDSFQTSITVPLVGINSAQNPGNPWLLANRTCLQLVNASSGLRVSVRLFDVLGRKLFEKRDLSDGDIIGLPVLPMGVVEAVLSSERGVYRQKILVTTD